MATDKVIRCPVLNCRRSRASGQVMCAPHWFSVPAELRDRIWQLFRASRGSQAHREAVFEAIDVASRLVEEKQSRD